MPCTMLARGNGFNLVKAGLLFAACLAVSGAAGSSADVIKGLQGAWVDDSTDCAMVFEKKGGEIRFKSRTFAGEGGFIISGKKARGPAGGICTITEVEEDAERFSAHLSCTDTLVSRNFQMQFRVVDEDHFERIDPDRPEWTIRHKRCRM